MNCPECNAENNRDSILCRNCESRFRFVHRADCDCDVCKSAQAQRIERQALADAAWEGELRIYYGWFVQAP